MILAVVAVATWWALGPWALVPCVVIWLALLSFFRDPPRRVPTGLAEGVMLSPADGVISAVERRETHEAIDGPAVIIRIFLSVLNVHVNRMPCDGTVVSTTHRPGQFLNAMRPESADVNESLLMVVQRPSGERLGVRQISGLIARRIVCALEPGDERRRGDRYGMIKFGSTTELILPDVAGLEIHVETGQRVRGGLTRLATMPDS